MAKQAMRPPGCRVLARGRPPVRGLTGLGRDAGPVYAVVSNCDRLFAKANNPVCQEAP